MAWDLVFLELVGHKWDGFSICLSTGYVEWTCILGPG